jgi:hypothetical protein
MREKLNSDPKTQVAAVAVLIVLAAFFFISKSGGGKEEEAVPTEATVAVAGSEATGTSTAATPGEAVEGAVENAVENASAEAGAVSSVVPSSIEAPPPPQAVTAAYKADETVVLLVVRDGAVDDKLVKQASSTLASMPEVALFVVPVSQISRYAAITLGVEVSRVPALVVMRPRSLSEGTPQATVNYGFQTRETIVQAVRDASYQGPPATYQPN